MSGAPWERYARQAVPVEATDAPPWEKYGAAAPPTPQQEPRGIGRTVDDAVRAIAQGATFGFADELAAAGNAAVGSVTGQPGTFGERYTQGLEAERARNRQFEQASPIASTALQVGGALANPITRMGVGGGLLRQIGGNAVVGGATGALAGFGEGEGGLDNRLTSAGLGGATGAVTGAAIPAIGTILAKGAKTVGGWMGLNNPKTDAERILLRAIAGDVAGGGDDLKALAAKLAALPADQPMMLPDVAGGSTMGLAQTVGREPGAGRAMATAAVDARGGLNQSARLKEVVQKGISAEDFMGTIDDLVATRARTSGPAYEKALGVQTPVNVAPILDDITARIGTAKGDIKASLERARALFLAGDGKPDTTMAGLHETKLAMDALLERSPTNSISRVARRELAEVQNKLLAAMDQASGGAYAEARATFAGPSRAMDAMDLGKRALKGDADETAAEIAKLSPSERDFFRIGVSRALIDKVRSAGDTADLTKLRGTWGNEAVRDRVAAAFDSPAQFKAFSDFMDNEMTMAKTNAVINPRGGSPTAGLLAERGQGAPAGPMLSGLVAALRGDMTGVGANVLRSVGALSNPTTAQYSELAPMLFAMKPGDRAQVIDRLLARETTDEGRAALARALAGGVRGAATSGAVQVQNN